MKRYVLLVMLIFAFSVAQAASITVQTNGPATYDGAGKLVAGTGLGFSIQVSLVMSNQSCPNRVFTIQGNTSSTRVDTKLCTIDKVIVEVMDGKLQGIKKEISTSDSSRSRPTSYSLNVINFGNDIGLEMMAMLSLFAD